jgi:hypothetical protein
LFYGSDVEFASFDRYWVWSSLILDRFIRQGEDLMATLVQEAGTRQSYEQDEKSGLGILDMAKASVGVLFDEQKIAGCRFTLR